MLKHMVLQAIATAFCGFLIKESYGQATKQLSKRFKNNSEEVEGVLASLLSLFKKVHSIDIAKALHNISKRLTIYFSKSHKCRF